MGGDRGTTKLIVTLCNKLMILLPLKLLLWGWGQHLWPLAISRFLDLRYWWTTNKKGSVCHQIELVQVGNFVCSHWSNLLQICCCQHATFTWTTYIQKTSINSGAVAAGQRCNCKITYQVYLYVACLRVVNWLPPLLAISRLLSIFFFSPSCSEVAVLFLL